MTTLLVFVFYIVTNAIPGNVDQFQMQTKNSDTETIQLDFIRQKDGMWKVIPDHDQDDVAYFMFDKKLNFHTHTGDKEQMEVIPLQSKLKMTKNKKNWQKVTKVMFELQEKKGDEKMTLNFNIQRKSKKQLLIKMDASNNTGFEKTPVMKFTWK